MPDHKQCWKCGTQVELVDEEGLCWPCRLGDEAAWVHSSDVAKARIAELERERDELRRMLQHYTDTVKVSLKHADVCITEPKAPPAVAVPEQDLVRLDFMVDPDALKLRAFVPDPVRVLVTDPASIFITGILGESGRRMVASGMVFIMTRSLAEKLISHHVAIESRP